MSIGLESWFTHGCQHICTCEYKLNILQKLITKLQLIDFGSIISNGKYYMDELNLFCDYCT